MRKGHSSLKEIETAGTSTHTSNLHRTTHNPPHTPIHETKRTDKTRSLRSIKRSTFKTDLADWIEQVYLARLGKPSDTDQATVQNNYVKQRYDVQEEIAKRIAQDLHDDASQMLAVVCLKLASVARDCPTATAQRLDDVSKQLDEVCEHIRHLSHELRPIALERSGLKSALKLLAETAKKRFGVNVTICGDLAGVPPQVEIQLYRVAQAALSNVYRHANATDIDIQLWLDDRTIHCTISDNGTGMQGQDFSQSGGLGLIGIHERVHSIGGTCTLISRYHEGLSLAVEIPR